jgi:hypothetical protein
VTRYSVYLWLQSEKNPLRQLRSWMRTPGWGAEFGNLPKADPVVWDVRTSH